MDGLFTFWFPALWTCLGALASIIMLFFVLFPAYGRRTPTFTKLEEIGIALVATGDSLAALGAVQRDVEALKMALAPHGESIAEELRVIRQSLIGDNTGSRDTAVLLEILAELRKFNAVPE